MKIVEKYERKRREYSLSENDAAAKANAKLPRASWHDTRPRTGNQFHDRRRHISTTWPMDWRSLAQCHFVVSCGRPKLWQITKRKGKMRKDWRDDVGSRRARSWTRGQSWTFSMLISFSSTWASTCQEVLGNGNSIERWLKRWRIIKTLKTC